MLSLNTTLNN